MQNSSLREVPFLFSLFVMGLLLETFLSGELTAGSFLYIPDSDGLFVWNDHGKTKLLSFYVSLFCAPFTGNGRKRFFTWRQKTENPRIPILFEITRGVHLTWKKSISGKTWNWPPKMTRYLQGMRKLRDSSLFADATAISGRYFGRVLLDFFVKKSV